MPEKQNQKENVGLENVIETEGKKVVESENRLAPQIMPSEAVRSHPVTVPIAMAIIIAVVVGLLSFTSALYLGETGVISVFGEKSEPMKEASDKGSYDDGYQAGLDFAEGIMRQRGFLPLATQVNYLYGARVKSVNGRNIKVEVDATTFDFFGEGIAERTVIVPDTVKIYQNVPRSQQELNRAYAKYNMEIEAYQKAIESGKAVDSSFVPSYPETFTAKEVSVSEIKEGDTINLYSDVDIVTNDIFEPTSIELFYVPDENFNPSLTEALETTGDNKGFEIPDTITTEESTSEAEDVTSSDTTTGESEANDLVETETVDESDETESLTNEIVDEEGGEVNEDIVADESALEEIKEDTGENAVSEEVATEDAPAEEVTEETNEADTTTNDSNTEEVEASE